MANKKADFAEALYQLALASELAGENDFKVRAFRKAADTLNSIEIEWPDLLSSKNKVPGIGAGILALANEFSERGKLSADEELRKTIPAVAFELLELDGIGSKKALALIEALELKTLGELEYACRENRLLSIKGFGEKAQAAILASIELRKRNAGRVRLDEALGIVFKIREQLLENETLLEVGALARRCEIIDVIELLVSSKKSAESRFSKLDLKNGTAAPEVKIKFHFTTETDSEKLAALVYGLTVDKVFQPHVSVHDPYSWAEKTAPAKKSVSYYRQSRDGSCKGVFHVHTTESDGRDSLENMVREAERLGYEYIGISDHSKSAFYARGLSVEAIQKQKKEIKALQKKVSIRIFHGIESDILQDGSLDYDDEVLDEFDFVIGSIHSRFKMSAAEMTERLCRALSNHRLTIWGHPTGRLLLGREAYAFDEQKVFKAAKKNNTIIELNANPQRLDIDWRHGPLLREHGLSITISPDAHETAGLSDTRFGEWMAEKTIIDREKIFNLQSVEAVEKYLCERKR